jgi:hypothetical protein
MIQLEGRAPEAQNYEDHMVGVYPVKTKHFQTAVFSFYRYRGNVRHDIVLGHAMNTYGTAELYTLLTLALNGDQWSALHHSHFTE